MINTGKKFLFQESGDTFEEDEFFDRTQKK